MSKPDRDKVVELLQQLGGSDDEKIVRAARELSALVQASDADWDDLLVSDPVDPEPVHRSNLGDLEARTLIDRLLARDDLSDLTREELTGYKEDITEGEFTDDDRHYLQALEARL